MKDQLWLLHFFAEITRKFAPQFKAGIAKRNSGINFFNYNIPRLYEHF